ncbi:DUF5811 family protein [Halobacteriaceae archaeon GCM10025711]
MNGNTPYGGLPGVVDAGTRPELGQVSTERRRTLSDSAARVAAQTREYLPGEYVVGSEVSAGMNGPRATIAVRPPIGNPVSAGFEPEEDDRDEDLPITEEDCKEVARGLAASAAFQVKQALQDGVAPTAR